MTLLNERRTLHLVDPEVAPPLDYFPPFNLSPATLVPVRELLANMPTPADPAALFPDVTRTEHVIPGRNGDPDVGIILYRPHTVAASAPALIWMHGGGFVLGSAQDDDLACHGYAAGAGAVVVSVDYRLAPETPAPGPLNDCYAALSWSFAHAEELGIDPDRIAVGGASAGGGLAACLAILARDLGEIPVCFQLLAYPMLDDRTASSSEAGPYQGEFVWEPGDNRFGWSSYLGRTPGGDDVTAHEAAARVATTDGLPPAYIAVGSVDLFAEEDLAYAQRLIRAGVPVELHVYPGGYHGFVMAAQARITQAYRRDLAAALARALEPKE